MSWYRIMSQLAEGKKTMLPSPSSLIDYLPPLAIQALLSISSLRLLLETVGKHTQITKNMLCEFWRTKGKKCIHASKRSIPSFRYGVFRCPGGTCGKYSKFQIFLTCWTQVDRMCYSYIHHSKLCPSSFLSNSPNHMSFNFTCVVKN